MLMLPSIGPGPAGLCSELQHNQWSRFFYLMPVLQHMQSAYAALIRWVVGCDTCRSGTTHTRTCLRCLRAASACCLTAFGRPVKLRSSQHQWKAGVASSRASTSARAPGDRQTCRAGRQADSMPTHKRAQDRTIVKVQHSATRRAAQPAQQHGTSVETKSFFPCSVASCMLTG